MSFVLSQQDGPILTLTLNRPDALNALNAQVLDDLDAALDTVDLDTVRCIIFIGAGQKAFAAGADIAAMASMAPEEAAAFSRRQRCIPPDRDLPPPHHRRRQRLRPGGRVRAQHGLRHPAVQRKRRLRPA